MEGWDSGFGIRDSSEPRSARAVLAPWSQVDSVRGVPLRGAMPYRFCESRIPNPKSRL
ncbi:hypothetical protein SAMN04488509_11388 [Aquimonas voraii]|uniref:Uncharacterized protein n=1 Tax=Aquimonas voraii TaxID=265719 RepID=A0A1G6ZGU1_9GAMM|nr:hypothetical protein SAMN04488509_11388 [Aquimonas voraii]